MSELKNNSCTSESVLNVNKCKCGDKCKCGSKCKCNKCPCPPDCQTKVKKVYRYLMDTKEFLSKCDTCPIAKHLVVKADELLDEIKCPH